MKELILMKSGEIALKGLNRGSFEDLLIKNAKYRLKSLGKFRFFKAQSTLYAEPQEEGIDLDEAVDRLSQVFGIAALCRACVVEKDFDHICQQAKEYLAQDLLCASTFKVEAKRSDKSFPMKSPDICRELGGFLLEQFPHLSVDVHEPDVTVTVEIRDFAAYIHARQLEGAGGIPVGSSGKGALLISGGIDSPVAGYMMAKRGMQLCAVHFVSPPYTSERAKLKVLQLLKQVSRYAMGIQTFIVPFTEVQEQIKDRCPEEFFTIIMRRLMMQVAQRICEETEALALITGESVGQVASQTVQAIACTDAVCQVPVFRPVIGMDKKEIVAIANRIGTFETSILPYEDCCTVFTPRHPRTRPKLAEIQRAEEALDIPGLLERCLANVEKIWVTPGLELETEFAQ